MRFSQQNDTRRTFDQLLDEYVDAVSEEFGLNLNLNDVDNPYYHDAVGPVYDSIRTYATQLIVENLLKLHFKLPLKKDEDMANKARDNAIESLRLIPTLNIAPVEDGVSISDRRFEKVPCAIQENEALESLRSRFDRAINNVSKTIFAGPVIGL